jgi:hypothetical protein
MNACQHNVEAVHGLIHMQAILWDQDGEESKRWMTLSGSLSWIASSSGTFGDVKPISWRML